MQLYVKSATIRNRAFPTAIKPTVSSQRTKSTVCHSSQFQIKTDNETRPNLVVGPFFKNSTETLSTSTKINGIFRLVKPTKDI